MKTYRMQTKATKAVRDEALSLYPQSPTWRESVINFYNDELSEFMDTFLTSYKRTIFVNDFMKMRKQLRGLVNKPILSMEEA